MLWLACWRQKTSLLKGVITPTLRLAVRFSLQGQGYYGSPFLIAVFKGSRLIKEKGSHLDHAQKILVLSYFSFSQQDFEMVLSLDRGVHMVCRER